MDAALAIALWFHVVRPPAFSPTDVTRIAESLERERGRIRASIALSPAVTPAEAERRSAEASERGGSVSGLALVDGRILR
jgi:GTP cyclohydrolase III